ncbi:ABC transporter ATP-binding protein [Soehngenia longivitae]|uniref:ABC transporter ATP-binding protein n=1 Tax=Soehngenia longivitae TaxID=2562294 RepID=A0A4Z0D4V3_9FIRM|nr:ABC transporter ATP-binding protein [Soehngenia longivitae]TFZ39504.1 ABC transporter ATP-binding protein [Soehngenia longivitae]
MNYIFKYAKKYKKDFTIAIIFLVLETLIDLILPTMMSFIIDNGVKNNDLDYVLKFSFYMLIITLLGASFAVIRNIKSSIVSQSIGKDLREDLYIKINRLSASKISSLTEASLITRLTNDVNQIQNFAHGLMRVFVKAPLLGIGSVIMALALDRTIGLISLLIVPIVMIAIILNLKFSYPIFLKIQKSLDKVNSRLKEYLSGIRVVKAFNRYDYERQRFESVNDELKNVSISGMRRLAIFSPLVTLLVNLGIVIILWVGSDLVVNADFEVGKIVAVLNYMTQLLFSLVMSTRIINMYIRSKASSDRLDEVFNAEETLKSPEKPLMIEKDEILLEFKNVYFKYFEKTNYVLEDINFKLKPNTTLAIIGTTGSGKSTIVNLVLRFFDPNSGEIKFYGKNIKDLDLKKYREKIAVVPQKNLLFTGTILDNLRWGNENASFDEIVSCSKIAMADDFIKTFKDGYDTYLGQGGVNLSGGQKQRISIARALLKNPELLILDDATSSVDLITERKIKERLKNSLSTTTILIAQRITSVMDAENIIVLDDGKIEAIGTHDYLLDHSEIYKSIYISQLGEEVSNFGA